MDQHKKELNCEMKAQLYSVPCSGIPTLLSQYFAKSLFCCSFSFLGCLYQFYKSGEYFAQSSIKSSLNLVRHMQSICKHQVLSLTIDS